jgi:hypothetical protein
MKFGDYGSLAEFPLGSLHRLSGKFRGEFGMLRFILARRSPLVEGVDGALAARVAN